MCLRKHLFSAMDGGARQPRGQSGRACRAKIKIKVEPHNGTGDTPMMRASSAKPRFLPFQKALLCARSLKLKNRNEWRLWCTSEARRPNIPSAPDKVYKHDGWEGYGHWLGTGNVGVSKDQEFMPFKKALLCARSLKLKTKKEWVQWSKSGERPAHIPSHPDRAYKHDGWQGWEHWLGTGNVGVSKDRQFLPFKEALLHARSLKLKARTEWKVWWKTGAQAANVPSSPDQTHKHDGWQGWGHWLGTGNLHTTEFLPFKKALLHAHSLKLKGQKEWAAWCKTGARLPNVPSTPRRNCKHDGWQGHGHWLGTGNVGVRKDQQFLPFKKALLCARSLKLKGAKEWEQWCKSGARPANVPSDPHSTCKHAGWQGHRDWLGTGTVANKDCISTRE